MGRIKQQTFRLCSSVFLIMVTGCATEQMMMEEAGDSATQVLAQSPSLSIESEVIADKVRRRRRIHAWDEVLDPARFPDTFFKHYGVNPTIDTSVENVSTFSADVDTASYSISRAYLKRGVLPVPEAVRVEEFVNAFDYDYSAPSNFSADAFTVHTEGFPSPTRKGYHVLHLGLKGQHLEPSLRKSANLIFVVDVSGSMASENRLGLVKRSLGVLGAIVKYGV